MPGRAPRTHVDCRRQSSGMAGDKPGHDGAMRAAVYSALLTSLIRGSAFSIRLR